MIKIPRRFWEDHKERDLPTPPTVRQGTRNHVWIDPTHSAMPELIADARHYASNDGPETPGLRLAAKALLRALGT